MSFASRDDRTLRGRLSQKIGDQVAEETALLANGQATGFDDYRFRVGRIQALTQVSIWLDDIVADLNAAPRHD